jgi:hypothetical protein
MSRRLSILLWKESLEVSQHAVPVALLIALFVFWGVASPYWLQGDPDPARHFIWLIMLGGLGAAMIGYRQTSRERDIGMWGFAAYGPASVTEVFGAKLVVGISAVIAMVFIPFALAMWRFSTPGVRAVPFDRSYWLPGIADAFVALMCYCCGLYTGSRASRRVTRIAGPVLAIAGYAAATGISSFSLAILTTMIIGVVMLCAAWADFATASEFTAKPWWGRTASVAVAIPAVGAVLVFAFAMTGWFAPRDNSFWSINAVRPQVFVNRLGRIDTLWTKNDSVRLGVIVTDTMPTTERSTKSTAHLGYRQPRRWVTRVYTGTPGSAWYYQRRDGLISIYDDASPSLRGYLGPDGFTEGTAAPAARFSGYLQDDEMEGRPYRGLLVLSGGVYELKELDAPRRLIVPRPGEIVVTAKRGGRVMLDQNAPSQWYTAVVTNRRVVIIDDASGAEQLSVEHPAADSGRNVRVYRAAGVPGAPTFIWYSPRFRVRGDTLHHVLEFRKGSRVPVAEYRFGGVMYER